MSSVLSATVPCTRVPQALVPCCTNATHPHAVAPKCNMERKSGLEERHTALLELSVILFHMTLLYQKQDWIAEDVLC